MSVKSSFSLPDELHAAWKASGLTLPELVRRGLDDNTVIRRVTTAEARFATADQRLAAIEHRLAQLEASSASMFSRDDLADITEPLSEEETEQLRADEKRHIMDGYRALLLAKVPHPDGEPVVVDTAAAVTAFGVGDATARCRMRVLTGYGYARQLDRRHGTGQPYEWVIEPPDSTAAS